MPTELNLNQPNIAALTKCIKAGEVVPFVGAGLSAPFGYPQWESFLRRCADEIPPATSLVNYLLNNKEFERAAAILYETTYNRGMIEKIIESFGGPRYQREDLREKLSRVRAGDTTVPAVCSLPLLFKGLVATTNLDCLLNDIYREHQGTPVKELTNTDDDVINHLNDRDRTIVFKIHGHANDDKSRIFSRSEYQYHYLQGISGELIDENKNLPRTLARIFLDKTVLFLGCSLYPDLLLRVLRGSYERSQRRHFAIVPRREGNDDAWRFSRHLDAHGIDVIFYPEGRYDCITQLLLHVLKEQDNAEYSSSNISARRHPRRHCEVQTQCPLGETFEMFNLLFNSTWRQQNSETCQFISAHFPEFNERMFNGIDKFMRFSWSEDGYRCIGYPAISGAASRAALLVRPGETAVLTYQPEGRFSAEHELTLVAEPTRLTCKLRKSKADLELTVGIQFKA